MTNQYDDYPAELELDFDHLDLDAVALAEFDHKQPCPLCAERQIKPETARNRCEMCGRYIVIPIGPM